MRPIGVLSDNEKTAVAMKRGGATYAQIGKALGLSGSQAKVLEAKGLRAESHAQSGPAHNAQMFLSVRAYNALKNRNINISDEGAHHEVAKMRVSDLMAIPNLSKKSIAQIQEWLLSNGLSLAPEGGAKKHKPICPHCRKVI